MVFTSLPFLFLFLPLFLAAYALTPTRRRSWTILVGSYLFYGWWRFDLLLLLIAVSVATYLAGAAIAAAQRNGRPSRARAALTLGVAGNLAALAFFKYAGFVWESLAPLMAGFGREPGGALAILLPIGISFYVFQAISYLVDVARRDTPPAPSFVAFGAFVALFPQLIAGPILRYKDVAGQFAARRHSAAGFSAGAQRFMIGFSKKVLLADGVAPLADAAFAANEPGLLLAWLGVFAYTAQLYFDFSGYSDMAIGLGRMMGFRFLENFDRPYLSASITEFWRRWHISLSNWLRDYLYIPLGGNRRGASRTYANLAITMLLGGLWHGASWTFVLWGAWHGLFLIAERAAGVRSRPPARRPHRVAATLLIVMLGWVLFRAESVAGAVAVVAGMAGLQGAGPLPAAVGAPELITLAVAALVAFRPPWRAAAAAPRSSSTPSSSTPMRSAAPLLAAAAFVLALSRVIGSNASPFLYFQF
jgi:alginate O-acetyltransferase complex protein AlgI